MDVLYFKKKREKKIEEKENLVTTMDFFIMYRACVHFLLIFYESDNGMISSENDK